MTFENLTKISGRLQPIDTAPKDGSEILLYRDDPKLIWVGRWVERETLEFGLSVSKIQYWTNPFIGGSGIKPTHWWSIPEVEG